MKKLTNELHCIKLKILKNLLSTFKVEGINYAPPVLRVIFCIYDLYIIDSIYIRISWYVTSKDFKDIQTKSTINKHASMHRKLNPLKLCFYFYIVNCTSIHNLNDLPIF